MHGAKLSVGQTVHFDDLSQDVFRQNTDWRAHISKVQTMPLETCFCRLCNVTYLTFHQVELFTTYITFFRLYLRPGLKKGGDSLLHGSQLRKLQHKEEIHQL